MVLRWLAITALVVFVARRRSLTAWILVSMVIGAEVGHDFAGVAVELRVLSQIFLRLITHHRRAAAVCDAGRRHRRPLEPASGRTHGRAGADLLRGGDDVRAVDRMGGDHHQPRRRRHRAAAAGWRARRFRRRRRTPGRTPSCRSSRRTSRARSSKAQMLQIVVFSVIFAHRARAHRRGEAPPAAVLRREPRRDDVPVHADRHADGADWRGRGDRLHGRQSGRRHSRQPGASCSRRSTSPSACSSSACCCRWRCMAQGAAAGASSRRWPSRSRSPLPPPAPRPRCRAPWRRWSGSACRVRLSRS